MIIHNLSSLTHGVEPFLRSRQLCSYSRTSQHFMAPQSSLPCSQEPSTSPYTKPHQSTSSHPISLRSTSPKINKCNYYQNIKTNTPQLLTYHTFYYFNNNFIYFEVGRVVLNNKNSHSIHIILIQYFLLISAKTRRLCNKGRNMSEIRSL
jgi:hypothetical protein